jgi:hypothetical protein
LLAILLLDADIPKVVLRQTEYGLLLVGYGIVLTRINNLIKRIGHNRLAKADTPANL